MPSAGKCVTLAKRGKRCNEWNALKNMHEFNESVMNQFEYRILKQLLRRALEICSVEKAILVLFQNESWSTTFHMKINLVCKTMDVQEKFISI